MRKMTTEEFKKDALEMLKTFADFCEKHNLKYTLDYGTLLGAVRHKGFIPWDDDIDVSMPRDDYEKLYKLLEKQGFAFTDKYKLASTRNQYNVYKMYFNIVDVATITESKCRKEKYYYPVWIDIFPCDEMDLKHFNTSKVKKLTHLAQIPLFKSKKKKIKNIAKSALAPFSRMVFRQADHACQVHNGKGFMTLHNYSTPYGKKDIIRREYFDDYIYGEFEGCRFRIPRQYDERLSSVYGNYMELPPADKRIPHVNDAFYLDGERTHA